MRMKREESSTIFYGIIPEKLSCDTSIFTGDIVCFFEGSKGSQSDIFEVTDWCGDDT